MNKYYFSITIIVCILIVGIPTFISVKNNHEEKLIKVTENKIKEAAKKCYLEKKCNGETTLNNLYELGYLEKEVNPVTKKYYDENSIINHENKKIVLNLK